MFKTKRITLKKFLYLNFLLFIQIQKTPIMNLNSKIAGIQAGYQYRNCDF